MKCLARSISLALGVLSILLMPCLVAADEQAQSPQQWLHTFSNSWNDTAWLQKSGFRPNGYMRPLNDSGWRIRMDVFRRFVTAGNQSVKLLTGTLKSRSVPQRIFAAQTLGYLPAQSARRALLNAARNDPSPTVRLYAVDSLGMLGKSGRVDWRLLSSKETNGDVKKHIGYAIERKGKAVASGVSSTLKRWNPKTINSAVVGKPAPDFELTSATGKKVRLSQFKGRKVVVLVFIYGDT